MLENIIVAFEARGFKQCSATFPSQILLANNEHYEHGSSSPSSGPFPVIIPD